MTYDLDHFFVLVDENTQIDSKLKPAGLNASKPFRFHEGQGTKARFIFFKNLCLEFLVVHDINEATKNIQNINSDLNERAQWKKNNAFPYGIALKLNDYESNWTDLKDKFHAYENAKWMKGLPPIYIYKQALNSKNPMHFILPEVLTYTNYLEKNGDDLKSISSTDIEIKKVVMQIPERHPSQDNLKLVRELIDSSIEFEINSVGRKWNLILYADFHHFNGSISLNPEIPVVLKAME